MSEAGSMPVMDPAFLAETRAPEILFGSIIPAAIATIFVFARLYSRVVIMKNWGYDDLWIFLSWIQGAVVITVLNCVLTHYGAGRHIETLTAHDGHMAELIGYVCRILYQICVMTTKIGVCFFYARIFQDRWSKIFVWSMVASLVLFSIPITFAGIIFRCTPTKGSWIHDIPATCRNDVVPLYAGSILNITADVALLIFVLPKILRLHIALRQKIGLLVVVCLSVLVIAATIIRLVLTKNIDKASDVPWDDVSVTIWTSIEVNTGLFCASAPAIKPLLRKIAPRLLSFTEYDSNEGPTRRPEYGGNSSLFRSNQTHRGTFELNSQTELGYAAKNESSSKEIWSDSKVHKGSVNGDDDDSIDIGNGGIQKTVSVTMSGHLRQDADLEQQASTIKFEPV